MSRLENTELTPTWLRRFDLHLDFVREVDKEVKAGPFLNFIYTNGLVGVGVIGVCLVIKPETYRAC